MWAKQEYGNLQNKLAEVEAEIHKLDLEAEEESITLEGRKRRRELKSEMWKLSKQVEWM